MIPLPFAKDKTYAVFGLARSGLAAARVLEAAGAQVLRGDDKSVDGAAMARFWDGLPQADALILAPGVPLTHPKPHSAVTAARKANVPIRGDIDLFAQAIAVARGNQVGPKIVAVTGTNGKSTTTALIAHILRALKVDSAMGGNIGVPVFDLPLLSAQGVYALELSSFQIDLSSGLAADVACLTNVTPDHLDRHGDFATYAAVKRALLTQARVDGAIIIAIDTPASRQIAEDLMAQGRKVTTASVKGAADLRVEGGWMIDQGAKILDLAKLTRLPGAHNAENILIAYGAMRALGLASNDIAEAIASFPGLAHRLELVAELGGVRFVNDSKATNADAAEKALASFDKIHWILGGIAKAGGIDALRPLFPRVAHAYLIGQAAEDFAKTLQGAVAFERCGTLDLAVKTAHARAKSGEVVVLSPACASQDQFRDFEHRGDVFRNLVLELGA